MSINKFDDLLTIIGTGPWNLIFFFADAFWELTKPAQFLSGVYLAPEIAHTCLPPEGLNVSGISQDSCHYYLDVDVATSDGGGSATESYSCTEWEYDNSTYTSTLTSEFNLVCSNAHLRATYQSIPVIATILTSPFIGYLSDRYGRKKLIIFTLTVHTFASFSIAFANDITLILCLRFIQGSVGLNAIYALALEVCEMKMRSFVGILVALPWAIGSMAFGGLAYLIRDWRYLHLTCSLPNFIKFGFFFFLDESPRWLILQGKHDSALSVLKKASRWNKVQLPPEPRLRELFLEIQKEQDDSTKKKSDGSSEKKEKSSWKDYIPKMIRTPRLRARTIVLSTMLLMSSFVYTGLALSGDSYSSDPFLYIVLGGLMEVPAYTISAPIINWLGRKRPAMAFFFFCGIVVLALAFIPKEITWLLMTLAMLGKLSNSMAFMILFVYMSELFPTEVRMQGISISIASECVGTTIAPYMTSYLGPMVPWLPSVLFGISSFIAAVLFFPLPETLGKPMIETVEALEGDHLIKERNPDEPNAEKKSLTDIGTAN